MVPEIKKSGSFMHLYLGLKKLPSDSVDLECHHSVIMDWSKPIDAAQNMVIMSVPTVFDEALAPEGYHLLHAYTAASEDFGEWEEFLEGEEEGADGEVRSCEGLSQVIKENAAAVSNPHLHAHFARRSLKIIATRGITRTWRGTRS